MYKKFKDEVENDFDKENIQTDTHRARRARAHGFSSVPEQASFLAKKTFQTPKKAHHKQIEKGNASNKILLRVHHCTGFPIEIVSQICFDFKSGA